MQQTSLSVNGTTRKAILVTYVNKKQIFYTISKYKNFPNFIGDTRIKQHTFGRRGFPSINVGHDPDIPSSTEGNFSYHKLLT